MSRDLPLWAWWRQRGKHRTSVVLPGLRIALKFPNGNLRLASYLIFWCQYSLLSSLNVYQFHIVWLLPWELSRFLSFAWCIRSRIHMKIHFFQSKASWSKDTGFKTWRVSKGITKAPEFMLKAAQPRTIFCFTFILHGWTVTFRLVCCSCTFEMLLLFVHGQC